MTPTLPNIPTDNLYKFKAISAVILLMFFVFSILYSFYVLFNRYFELKDRIDRNNIEVESFVRDIGHYKSIRKIMFNYLSKMNNPYILSKEEFMDSLRNKITHRQPNFSELFNQDTIQLQKYQIQDSMVYFNDSLFNLLIFNTKLKDYKSSMLEEISNDQKSLYDNEKQLLIMQKELINLSYQMKIIVCLGLLIIALLVYGAIWAYIIAKKNFDEWYNKLQKYQDEIIIQEAEDRKQD